MIKKFIRSVKGAVRKLKDADSAISAISAIFKGSKDFIKSFRLDEKREDFSKVF